MRKTKSIHRQYIGLMSGTSMDGIDAVLVRFEADSAVETLDCRHFPYPDFLNRRLNELVQPDWQGTLREIADLDHLTGQCFASASETLLNRNSGLKVSGIGSHGQTIFHNPSSDTSNSWQIGDPNIIAEKTGVPVVSDFRRRDIACGGQGAPLVPAFHQYLFGLSPTIVLNLGGIANITLLAQGQKPLIGFDTGPANTLMDNWIHGHLGYPYDHEGQWASNGNINEALLRRFLTDEYFQLKPPKSTGREHFNRQWLNQHLAQADPVSAIDVQATLCELTAVTVAYAITSNSEEHEYSNLLVCGGGAKNAHLKSRLQHHLPTMQIDTVASRGVDPDYLEAAAFAWLAKQTLEQQPGNSPSVTGACGHRVLGAVYPAL